MIHSNEGGEKSEAFNKEQIVDYRGEVIEEVEQHPSIAVSDDVEQNKEASKQLRDIEIEEWMETLEEAADNLQEKRENTDLVENIARSTGNPVSSVDNSVQAIEDALRDMDQIMDAQLPGEGLEVLDDPVQDNYALVPKGENLGIIAPSNHPSVMALPTTALGTQTPLTIRPAQDDVFTSQALVESIYEAGAPEDSIYFLPGNRDVSEKVIEHSDQTIAFGGEKLEQSYGRKEGVHVFGPGESTIYIDEEFIDSEEVYDVVEEAMMRDGGRGCINASQVLTNGDSSKVAQRIAERASNYEVKDVLDPEAEIPAFKETESAEQINHFLSSRTSPEQVNNSGDERIVEHKGGTYLRPTVVELDSYDSELATELPFQYMTVAEIEEEEFRDAISGSLSLALFTEYKDLREQALYHPEVEKVYTDGAATCEFRLTEPHEGYITDTLMKKKAYRGQS